MPKVKILWFVESTTERTEREIEQYLSEGWRIVAAGGGGNSSGFIVLQKDSLRPEGQEVQKRSTQPLEKPAAVGAARATGTFRHPPREDETQTG
jgi:hypothetical protein